MSNPHSKPILVCRKVGKSFAGVTVLESVDFDLRPGEVHTLMGENGAGKSTLMKILAGVHRPDMGELLLRDEPTAALTPEEVGDLFRITRRLRDQGTAIVFISHRLEEVFSISDRITVLRDGHCIGTREVAQTSKEEIIRMMVGRELGELFDKPQTQIGEPRLRVENLSSEGRFADVSFEVRRGEILGVAGLVGAGRTDVAQTIFGIHPRNSGSVSLDG